MTRLQITSKLDARRPLKRAAGAARSLSGVVRRTLSAFTR